MLKKVSLLVVAVSVLTLISVFSSTGRHNRKGGAFLQEAEALYRPRRDCWFSDGCRPTNRLKYCAGSNCIAEPQL